MGIHYKPNNVTFTYSIGISDMMSFCILDNYLLLLIVVSLNAMLIVSLQPELKLVNVVFRHGDRTPGKMRHEMYPNDPYVNYSFYPIGDGELINQGKKREYELGQALRNRYRDFLGDMYLPKLVKAHTSDTERTKMSLQLVLAALFPPTDTQRWKTDLNWQPIPATYVPRMNDKFFLGNECPQFINEYNRIRNLPEIKKRLSQLKNPMNKLTELTGKNIETPMDFYHLYQTFVVEYFMNLTLPNWAYDYFPDGPLFDGLILAFNFLNFNPSMRTLFTGSMIRGILDNMIVAKNPNPPNTKIYLYSGHDGNIVNLLQIFGVYEPHFVAYSSAFVTELYEFNQEYYVKLFRHGDRTPNFLGDLYQPKLVMGHSSDTHTTKMSLQLVLAGLFPPTDTQQWNNDLNWQPIPITYVPRVTDNFFLSYECPQYIDEYNRIINLPEIEKKKSQNKNVLSKLTELTGKNIETPIDWLALYQTFLSESFMNLTLPKWAYDYFPDGPLLDGVALIYDIGNYNALTRRLFSGPMLRAMANNMLAAKNPNPPNTKIYLYSGHDSNIAVLLQIFGVYKPHLPAYSSAFVTELYKFNQEYYVKLLYYRGIPPIFEELQIPGYDVLCSFNKFLDFMKDLFPLNDEIICDKRQTPDFAHIKYPVDLQKITLSISNMMLILQNYLSLLVIISLNTMLIVSIQPELKLVNVLFRHGDRTPEKHEIFPNDPYINDSFRSIGRGELTNQGKKREYELGQALRNRYKDFLGNLYQPKLVMAHSSDTERTKMSLQLVLAGLFPPADTQRWKADLNWQPIPITYVPRVVDNFFLSNECPQYLDEYFGILNLPEMEKKNSQFKNILSKLTELTGKNIETPVDWVDLYQLFLSESFMNLTLPNWAYDYFPDGPLFDAVVFAYNTANYNPLIRRLFSGPMLRAMANNMLAAKNPNPPDTKIYLYSGHDSNIAVLLQIFGVYKPHFPAYSSAIVLELQKINQEYYVKQGKAREYELGQVLRNRYKDFLGELYLPKLIMGHSSDYDRTKMSLQLVLAALFPPTDTRQRWNADLNWQPIPTTYIPRVDDNFFLSDECPQFLDEYERILNLPEIKQKMSQFTDIMNKLTDLTGKKIEKPLDLYYLYHTFVSESSLNLTLPNWAYDYFPDGPLFDGIVTAYDIANFTPLIRRLYAGPVIRAMLDNMIIAQMPHTKSLDTKIYLYSGHESNIATMLHAFNLYKPHVPEYSSAVILELLQQDKQYYVKFLYYRGIPSIIEELQIPGCEKLCVFHKFLNLIQDLIPSDEEMVCDKRKTTDYAKTEYSATLQSKMYKLISNSAKL
ncbi:uncharacterized protein LOC114936816 [Nylanderia fulva]|uniref:uncharacterized protein LOC114936816 n=1 Tax=Nylanderia fulva TaxID=613905 RepID=UPI0010FB3732|nr:uncharacterized protein LOC114936816 [Nylanderia fulva]